MPHINREKEKALSAERIRDRVAYDSDTGAVTWRRCRYRHLRGRQIGTMSPSGYRTVVIDGTGWCVHRLIWLYAHGRWPAEEIDHINGDRSDNRLCNLREATRAQNAANRSVTGASLHGCGRWMAQIRIDGKNVFLGLFNTVAEARAAYIEKAREVHGEFVRAA